ncbi:hypothetical protein BKI52_39275 [marine bacterium AO1-C]|nr:hypothetical protein BKI52_39275 [marine bacterium AO1-C]
MIKFLITNALFIIGMIVLIVQHIQDWRIWVCYITIWCIADYYFAKDFHLKWWQWALFIAGLSIIDLVVIRLVN